MEKVRHTAPRHCEFKSRLGGPFAPWKPHVVFLSQFFNTLIRVLGSFWEQSAPCPKPKWTTISPRPAHHWVIKLRVCLEIVSWMTSFSGGGTSGSYALHQ